MPDICIIPNCYSNSSGRKGYVRCFTFPTDQKQREKWLELIPRKNFNITKNTNVCVKHFEERFLIKELKYIGEDGKEQFMKNKTWRLVPNAVPTIFPVQKNTKRLKKANIEEESFIEHKKRRIKEGSAIDEITNKQASFNQKTCYYCGGYTDRLCRLYRAPNSSEMRRKWMKTIPNSNRSMFTEEFRLCAKHFEKKLIVFKKHLLKSAIPTIFQFDDDSRPEMKDYDTPASTSTVTKFDLNITLPYSRQSSLKSSPKSSPQYQENSEELLDWRGLAFEQILLESTPENCDNHFISENEKNSSQQLSPKITSGKIIQKSKSNPRFRYAGDVHPLKEYSPEESIQAIEDIKADLANVESNSNIIQKKVDILKMKISTYQQFIATLVAKDRISKESARLLQVLPSDVRRKEQIDLRKNLKNGDYSKALVIHDHDYL